MENGYRITEEKVIIHFDGEAHSFPLSVLESSNPTIKTEYEVELIIDIHSGHIELIELIDGEPQMGSVEILYELS